MNALHTFFFFFNDTATTEIYTLSLHALFRSLLPLSGGEAQQLTDLPKGASPAAWSPEDRKSTRLNSSHSQISYAVFCLKKKKKKTDESYIKRKDAQTLVEYHDSDHRLLIAMT